MKLSVLGSTGSIGVQTLDVVRAHPEEFTVDCLAAGTNGERLIAQAVEFHPKAVGIADKGWYPALKEALPDDVEIVCGQEAATLLAGRDVDFAVCAIVGIAGLDPFLTAMNHAGKVGLANKESMVCGGELVKGHATPVLPIDSEHSAIFQCLNAGRREDVSKLILTASGGPFLDLPKEAFAKITLEQALHHPNWAMGKKITIDSATMMNKGLEVIEAVRLFGVRPDQVEVVVHRESVVHSLVEYGDGSVLAQLGNADMRIPIQYALTYPKRLNNPLVKRLKLWEWGALHFERPDTDRFPCLRLAFDALDAGGLALTALNGANEAAVGLFLDQKIRFTDIPVLVEYGLSHYAEQPLTLESIHATHEETVARILADYQKIDS